MGKKRCTLKIKAQERTMETVISAKLSTTTSNMYDGRQHLGGAFALSQGGWLQYRLSMSGWLGDVSASGISGLNLDVA